MSECPHNELQRATVLEQTVCYCCKQCAAKFTIKPFEIQVTEPELVVTATEEHPAIYKTADGKLVAGKAVERQEGEGDDDRR